MENSKQGLDREVLRRWRLQAGLTRGVASARLGISPRMLAYYEDGVHDVPKVVVLAVRKLAAEEGIALPGAGMDRSRWVAAIGHAVGYARGEPVVGRLIKEGKRDELRDLIALLRDGPGREMALTDPAMFRTLRGAGTKAHLAGVTGLQVRGVGPAATRR